MNERIRDALARLSAIPQHDERALLATGRYIGGGFADARLAIELDGLQHLESADAYRRDRRKDLLLQENGYLVLRFLADDVGKHLDAVLDAIVRALTMRRRN